MLSFVEKKELKEKIAVEAKKLIGISFCSHGRTRFGLDCVGLIYLAYNRAGIPLPKGDGKNYKLDWFKTTDEERILNVLNQFFVSTIFPEKGDLITFKILRKNGPVNHLGIFIDQDYFIHARPSRKVQLQSLPGSGYRKIITGYLRYKELN